MSESKYESKIQTIPASAGQVYSVLSNLQNVDKVRHLIPEGKVQEMEVSADSIRVKVDGLGQKITVSIVERTENDTIKFAVEDMPMAAPINFWVQLKEVAPQDTRIKLTLKADIPMMLKVALGPKLQQGIDQAAEMLTQFPYAQWSDNQ